MTPIFNAVAIVAHAANQVCQGRLQAEPFQHLLVDEVFPPEFYAVLLDNMPRAALDAIKATGRDPSGENLLLSEYDSLFTNIQREVWSIALGAHRAMHKAALEVLAEQVSAQMAHLACAGYVSLDIGFDFDLQAQLLCRREEFEIGPHLHHVMEVLNALHYLPEDDSFEHQGTQLYTLRKPTRTAMVGIDYAPVDRDALDMTATLPYRANTAVFWVNTFQSIHAAHHGKGRPGGGGVERRYLFTYSVIPEAKRNDSLLEGDGMTIELVPAA